MDSTTLCAESKEDQEQVAKRMPSLYEVCQQLVDGSCARGKRYDLAGLLVVLVLAKLADMQSLLGATDPRDNHVGATPPRMKKGFFRRDAQRGPSS